MNYIEKLRTSEDMVTPGMSACQGCCGELVLRRILQIAGSNTIVCVPPGCMSGAGVVGWDYQTGMKIPVHIPLLTNTASFLSGVSQMYQRKGRDDVNMIAVAGDGATADGGFQSLSGAAERNEKMLYVCYDNEGYMNTGFQRSSTTTKGSRTSTTPIGEAINGKQQPSKYVALIMSMHALQYCATASPSHMQDLVAKIEHGLAESKKGFAFIHVIAPCPTGWSFEVDQSIQIAKKAVASNMFPLWEKHNGNYYITVENKKPIPVKEFLQSMGKYKNLTANDIEQLQKEADMKYETLRKLASE